MSQFYLTVSSDSQCHFAELNTTSKFKVHLGRVIELNGDWEVALFEIFYPETFENVRKGSCLIKKENIGHFLGMADVLRVKSQLELPSGFYHGPVNLCQALNVTTGSTVHFDVDVEAYNIIRMYANVVAVADEKINFTFSDELLDILGHKRGLTLTETDLAVGEISCDLKKGLPKSLKIYSDIVADQLVNSTHEKLLREVHLSPEKFKFGFQQHKNFVRLAFLPVIKKNLEYLEFHIKDEQDREVSFAHGTLKLILLFRRAGNGY